MAETAADRVVRMLALITYLQSHPDAPVDEVAEHFGVTVDQVLQDVNTLWVSGTPGYMPDDLIDFSADDRDRGILTLTDARGMDRPLRLGAQEAVALLTGLRTLRGTPGLAGDQVLQSTIAKLSAAAGTAARNAEAVEVAGTADGEDVAAEMLANLRAALTDGKVAHLRYVSVADEVTERDVDPLQLLTDSRHWFLIAWCHRAKAVRQFRLDRILHLRVLRRRAGAHPDVTTPRSPEPELAQAPWQARVRLAAPARWVPERYPVTSVADHEDGTFSIELAVLDPAWLQRLLLGLGEAVIAVGPVDLADQVRRGAHTALAAYAELDTGTMTTSPGNG